MRIVFMGTPAFALPSLDAVAREHELVAVYTRPDAVSGRGKSLRPTPVKERAIELGVPVEQPRTLRDAAVQSRLASYRPDAIVVAAYGLILPREVLDIPPLGCINVHGSLLPRWRGAAPVQRAILAGDETTGVSIMRMEEGLDTGPFCAIAEVPVGDKTADALAAEIAEAGASTLLQALETLAQGRCEWQVQDDTAATYADKLSKADVSLGASLTAAEALRRIRASGDTAPARLAIEGRNVRVIDAAHSDATVAAGRFTVANGALVLGLMDGSIGLSIIKPEGKGEMRAADWVRGIRLTEGTWEAAR